MFNWVARACFRPVIYSTVLAFWAVATVSFAHQISDDPEPDCEIFLLGSAPKPLKIEDQLDRLTLTGALVIRHSGLPANNATEIIRLQLLDGDRRPMELAIYNGSNSEAATARQRLRRMNRMRDLRTMLDPKSVVFVGRNTLQKVGGLLSTHPHIADLISRFGTFGRARYVDSRLAHLEVSPRLESKWAYDRIWHQFQDFSRFVLRRNWAAEEFQFLVSPTGEFQLINPEALRPATREQTEAALLRLRQKIEALQR